MGVHFFVSLLVFSLFLNPLASQQPNTNGFFVSEFLKKWVRFLHLLLPVSTTSLHLFVHGNEFVVNPKVTRFYKYTKMISGNSINQDRLQQLKAFDESFFAILVLDSKASDPIDSPCSACGLAAIPYSLASMASASFLYSSLSSIALEKMLYDRPSDGFTPTATVEGVSARKGFVKHRRTCISAVLRRNQPEISDQETVYIGVAVTVADSTGAESKGEGEEDQVGFWFAVKLGS